MTPGDSNKLRFIPRRLGRVLLVLFALGLSIFCAEIALRLYLHQRQSREIRALQTLAASHVRDLEGEVGLGDILRLSENSDIIYELIPGLGTLYLGHELKVNQLGFRGPEIEPRPAPEVIRILGLGDSVMFGYGVAEADTYLRRLEQWLNRDYPYTFEVINSGVPGYNAAMELATMEEKGLRLRPDLVILHSVGNDYGLPNFLADPVDYFALDRSFLWASVARSPLLEVGGLRTNVPVRPHFFEDNPAKVPPQYRHLVGKAAYERTISRLVEMSRIHDFELFATFNYETIGMEQVLRANGVEYSEYSTQFSTALRHTGEPEIPGSSIVLSKEDVHPSARGHYIIAANLYAHLHQSGLIDRAINSYRRRVERSGDSNR